MQSEDRLVHFSTELFHAPVTHERKALQKLYYDLSQTGRVSYDNIDFSQPGVVRMQSRRGAKTQSFAFMLTDRVVLVEEWADIALTTFYDKVKEVARRVLTDFPITLFPAQTATLRSTFSLTHFPDARSFLLDHVCQQSSRLAPYFQRPVGTGGLRFALPECEGHPGSLNVIIESFKQEKREVFVEVKGSFNRLNIDLETVGAAIENIQVCRRFISESIFPFLDQYDVPQEHPV